jgi:hypothetical protein
MGIVEEIKKLRNSKDVSNFRKEHLPKFYGELIQKLKEKGGWENLESIEKIIKGKRPNSSLTETIRCKYKCIAFNELRLPTGKSTAKKINLIDYFYLNNDEIFNRIIEVEKGKKSAYGIGISILKNDDKFIFRVGASASYGTEKGSKGEKINEESTKKGYQKDIKLGEQNEEQIINLIAEEFTNILNTINDRIANKNTNGKLSDILTALNTKPFLILAGVSGTGKTQIARIVAGVVAGEEKKEKNNEIPPAPLIKGGQRGDLKEEMI